MRCRQVEQEAGRHLGGQATLNLLFVMSSPLLIWANRADLSCPEESKESDSRDGSRGGGGGRPPGGGGGGTAAPFLAQTSPVVWCCLTKACSSVRVSTQAFTQSTCAWSLHTVTVIYHKQSDKSEYTQSEYKWPHVLFRCSCTGCIVWLNLYYILTLQKKELVDMMKRNKQSTQLSDNLRGWFGK